MNGCCSCVKILVVLLNLVFWLIGLALVLLAVWMLADPTFLVSMTQDEANYYYGLYIFLAVGSLMVFVAFLGCCGAFKESQCMLVSFFCCLLVVVTAEVAAGAWAYHNSAKLDNVVRAAVKHTVHSEYGEVPSRTVAFDAIQNHFECCGADGPNDYAASKYNKVDRTNLLDIAISTVKVSYKVPESCCKKGTDPNICSASRSAGITSSLNPIINHTGCMEKLVEEIKVHLKLIIAVGVAIVVVQILGLMLALLLCCAIRRNDHYKA